MKKTAYFVFIVFISSLTAFAQTDEEITITTYYPSPFGVYRNLRVEEITSSTTRAPEQVGSTFSVCTQFRKDDGATVGSGTCEYPAWGYPMKPGCLKPGDVNCCISSATCTRNYEPSLIIQQQKEHTGNSTVGNMGVFSLASDAGEVFNFSSLIPWPANNIAISGVSSSVGVYGRSTGTHPGVMGYSSQGVGVLGGVGDSGEAAIQGDGAYKRAIVGLNTSSSPTFTGINFGAGPVYVGWKPEGIGGYIADFNFAGTTSTSDNDYGLKVDVAGAVGIRSRSDDSAAFFATDKYDEQWSDYLANHTEGLVSIHRNSGTKPALISYSTGLGAPSAVFMSGNVGIGTLTPRPLPPNGVTNQNLDVNDIYLRSKSKWVSEMAGGIDFAPAGQGFSICADGNIRAYSIAPTDAKGVIFNLYKTCKDTTIELCGSATCAISYGWTLGRANDGDMRQHGDFIIIPVSNGRFWYRRVAGDNCTVSGRKIAYIY